MFIRQLRYLVALARERHFARAAADCHVSQPTLSAGLHKLECELDIRIIDHDSQFRGLTPEGERVLVCAQRILADWDSLIQDVGEARKGLDCTVRLGVVPAALPAVGLLVEGFSARHPAARVSIERMTSRSIEQRLAKFELDAGLTYLDNEPLRDVVMHPLYREHYVFLTAEGSSEIRSVSWEAAAAVPLCLLSQDMQMRRIIDAAFRSAGAIPRTIVEANSFIALYSLCGTGHGRACSHIFLSLFGVPPGVHAIPLTEQIPEHAVGVVISKHEPVSPAARALLSVAEGLTQPLFFDVTRPEAT